MNNKFKQIKKQVGLPILLILLTVLLTSCLNYISTTEQKQDVCQESKGALFRFVFLADSRGDYKAEIPEYISDKILGKITDNIIHLNPKPAFVIFNGDMVAKKAYKKAPEAVQKWKDTFIAPLKNNGIKIYTTPGNHVLDQKTVQNVNTIEYIDLFNKHYLVDNPLNGPGLYKGVTYSFTVENCHFATVTPYITHSGEDNTALTPEQYIQKKKVFEYYINDENMAWLQNDLKKAPSDFTIVFTHLPLYSSGPHFKDKKGLHAHPEMRDKFVKMLIDNETDVYFASHEHLYARARLSASNLLSSTFDGEILQVTVGSAGAPPAKKIREDMKFEKVEICYQYLVADVKKKSILFNVYDENNKRIDTFEILKQKKNRKKLL